jgi:hypothetical protein
MAALLYNSCLDKSRKDFMDTDLAASEGLDRDTLRRLSRRSDARGALQGTPPPRERES